MNGQSIVAELSHISHIRCTTFRLGRDGCGRSCSIACMGSTFGSLVRVSVVKGSRLECFLCSDVVRSVETGCGQPERSARLTIGRIFIDETDMTENEQLQEHSQEAACTYWGHSE